MRGEIVGRKGMLLSPLLGLLLLGAVATPAALAAPSGEPGHEAATAAGRTTTVLDAPPAGGGDAWGLRLTLLVSLGVALACGVVAQYQAISGDRRPAAHQPEPGAGSEGVAAPASATATRVGAAPAARDVPGRQRDGGSRGDDRATPTLRAVADRADPARQHCADAVAAAFVYDRARTVAAFAAALAADPAVQPTAAPGFWEMPSTGHADLARAYLRHGRPLDARTVLTVALLTFEHNRELTALLREATPGRAA